MENPLVTLARKIALHRHKCVGSVGLMPLEKMHKATLFLDSEDADSEQTKKLIVSFLGKYGIHTNVLCPQKWDVNWYGKMKKPRLRKGERPVDWDDDLFISLAEAGNFTSEFEARISHAKFKVGRVELPDHEFDLVLTNAEHSLPRQTLVWKVIQDYLLKIQ